MQVIVGLVVPAAGCYTGVVDFPHANSGGDLSAGDEGEGEGEQDDGDSDGPGDDDVLAGIDSRFPRLSHAQWENTVRDLLHLSELPGLVENFIDDPIAGGFDNQGNSFEVSSTLWGDYQRASETLADRAIVDPEVLAAIVPNAPGASIEDRARQFIIEFGRRAYRRPLTDDEVDDHLAAFLVAGADYSELDDFQAGVHLTLQTMLQSPHFIYRVVDGEEDDQGRIALDGWQRATRISYALWNTMPDDALLDAAASGALDTPAGMAAQAERLIDHPYAKVMVDDFHHQLLKLDKYVGQYRDPDFFPEFDPNIGYTMQQEVRMFIKDIIFEREAGYTDLLTATHTFANDELAAVYGLDAPLGSELTEVQLDPTQRSGLLTLSGFLMSRSYQVDPDPIHRGAFISFELLCNTQPAIPDNVSAPEPDPTKTNRERVNDHTGEGTCGAGCHTTLINPAGFAFEHFDATGAWRTIDNGKPINAADSFYFDEQLHAYDGAVEFSQIMADSHQAHACYSRHLLEYLHGRKHREADQGYVEELGELSRAGERSIRALMVDLVTSDDFTHLSTSPSTESP